MSESAAPARHFLPPPLVYIAGLLGGWGLQRAWPLPRPDGPLPGVLGWVCIAGWAVFALPGVLAFVRAHTSILPIRESTSLVRNGPYRLTRNPMYLGLGLLYLAIGLFARQPWVLVLAVPVMLVIDRFIVTGEERYLAHRFGREYLDYRARVRRWL